MTIALTLIPNLQCSIGLHAVFLKEGRLDAIAFFKKYESQIAAQVEATRRSFFIYYDVIDNLPDPGKRLEMTPMQASEILDSGFITSADDALIEQVKSNPHPCGIVSLNNGKVLFMNGAMPAFVNLPYDEIGVQDIAVLFQPNKKQAPTNLKDWNERLQRAKTTTEPILAYGSSGRFGWYYGKFSVATLYGVPVRVSEYSHFVSV